MGEKNKQQGVRRKGKSRVLQICFLLTGLASLIWFLIRVIPKPSRASYPCQRAAFPMASAFVIWLAGMLPAMVLFQRALKPVTSRKTMGAVFMILAVILFLAVPNPLSVGRLIAGQTSVNESFVPSDEPNSPVGTARGLFPGRVVWNYNPDATCWDGKTGYFWEDEYTDEALVNEMLSESLDACTGATSNQDAWDQLFISFNKSRGKGAASYREGEKIAIKINLSNSDTHGQIFHRKSITSPQLILALVRQLVESAHVPDSCITIFDRSELVPSMIYDKCHGAFPGLNFMDREGGDGRNQFRTDSACVLKWSKDLVLEPGGGFPTFLPECVSQADYIINLAILKGHNMAGITLCAKNHVGTLIASNPGHPELTSPQAAGFHPYATVHYFEYWDFLERPMGTYNTLVDLMGHKDLGNKTLLFMVDGLYASKVQNGDASKPGKWISGPFNNDWTSSIFLSQDPVALESVCLDFLRSEPTMLHVYGNVDNYLHEAAMADHPPSGTFYDPEGDGTGLSSLGVHEHWNNAADKSYSRDLGTGEGIELMQIREKAMGALTFSYQPGLYTEEIVLEVFAPVEGANIYYTIDGSMPTPLSIPYSGGIPISETTIVAAKAFMNGYLPSDMLSGLFMINKLTGIHSGAKGQFRIFPTLVSDILCVEITGGNPDDITIILSDMNGRMIRLGSTRVPEGTLMQEFDISGLAPGPYMVIVQTKGIRFYERIVKK